MLWTKEKSVDEKVMEIQKDLLGQEIERAKHELYVAYCHFNSCEPDYFGIANEQLTAAEKHLNAVMKKSKLIHK